MMPFHPARQSIPLLQYRPGTSFNDSVALPLPKRYKIDKGAYVQRVVKPLRENPEPVHVVSGSKAESAAAETFKSR
jgi:hypothetical protein